jgi:hypothetical protein
MNEKMREEERRSDREREKEKRESFYTKCKRGEEGDRDNRGRATTAIVLDQIDL